MDWLWDILIGSPVSPPGQVVPMDDHRNHCEAVLLWPLAVRSASESCPLQGEAACCHHEPHHCGKSSPKSHAPIFSNLCCFYQVFLSQKWKTNYHTFKPPGSSVWQSLTWAGKALPSSKDDFSKHNRGTDWQMPSQLAPQAANIWPMGLGRERNQIPGSPHYYLVGWGCSRLRLKVETSKDEILPGQQRELTVFFRTQTPLY